jgi:hypothetical protein
MLGLFPTGAQGGFPGFDVFQRQMKEGVARKRVGLATAAPAREHAELQTPAGAYCCCCY